MKKKPHRATTPAVVTPPPRPEHPREPAPHPAPPPTSNGKPSPEEIGCCAYLKWEAAGRPGNRDIEFWLAAERELSSLPSATGNF